MTPGLPPLSLGLYRMQPPVVRACDALEALVGRPVIEPAEAELLLRLLAEASALNGRRP